MLQRDPVQKLHDEIRPAIFLTDVVDSADIGMVERGCRLRFPPESFQCLAVLLQFFGKEFQRDKPSQARVFGFIDDAHAAAAQLLHDPVM